MKHEEDASATVQLDLLSNTTAVVLVLFLVLAGLNSLNRIHAPSPKREGTSGPMATLVELKPMKSNTPPDVVIAQLVLDGTQAPLRVVTRTEGEEASCEVFGAANGDPRQWLVVKTGRGGRCQIIVDDTSVGTDAIEATALVTRGDYILPVLGPRTLKHRNPAGCPVVMTICKQSRDGTGVVLGGSCGGGV